MERHDPPAIGPTSIREADLPELQRRIELAYACMKGLGTGHFSMMLGADDFGNPSCVSFSFTISGKLAASRVIGGLVEVIEQEFKNRIKCVRAAFSETIDPRIDRLVPLSNSDGTELPGAGSANGGAQ